MVRITTRIELAGLFAELGFNVGAEIGVLAGSYSKKLCQANPNLKLYLVDSWGIGENRRKEYHLRKLEEAKVRLKPFNVVYLHMLSMDAVKDFEDGSLDFVYIDANHVPKYVKEDIEGWGKKVRKGGVISGHDYAVGIIPVVNEYAKVNNLVLNTTTLEAEGISWWMVK